MSTFKSSLAAFFLLLYFFFLFEEDDLVELDIPSIAPSVGKMSVSIVAFKPVSRERGGESDVGGGGAKTLEPPPL